MSIHAFWIFAFCFPTVAVLPESIFHEQKTYVTDAQTRNALIIKTWTYRGSSLLVTVSKGSTILLNEIFYGFSSETQKNRLSMEYNHNTKVVSLMLNNVSRSDEGLYHISSSIFQETAGGFEKIDTTWDVQLNVLEPDEIKHGYAGDNIMITEFVQETIFFPRLYHNGQLIAVLRGSDCAVNTNSPFYGRIRCSKDKDINKTRIEIQNLAENDTGLYTVETEGRLTQRCFLNITVTYTTSTNVLNIANDPGSSNVINPDQPSNETLPRTVLSRSPVNPANSLSVPIYVIPVIIGAVGIIHLIGCLIWGQRRKIHITKSEQHIPQDECDPGLYLTPISIEPPRTVPTCQERKPSNSNIAQNKNIDPCTGSIHMAQIISIDGYEVVDISNEDPEITPALEEVMQDLTENCITPSSETSGYLTVMARTETTV